MRFLNFFKSPNSSLIEELADSFYSTYGARSLRYARALFSSVREKDASLSEAEVHEVVDKIVERLKEKVNGR